MHRLKFAVQSSRNLATLVHNSMRTRAGHLKSLTKPELFQKNYASSTSVAHESFLNGSTSNYVEEMYNAWLENPQSVHKVCEIFFEKYKFTEYSA